MQPAVKIDDRPLKVDDHGRFSAALPGEIFKEFTIEVVNKQGQSTSATFSVPDIEILKPEKNLILPFGVNGSGYRVNERSDALKGDGEAVVLYYDILGRTDPGNTVEIDGHPVAVEFDGTFQVPLALKQGMNPYGILVRNPEGISRIVNLLVAVNDKDEKGKIDNSYKTGKLIAEKAKAKKIKEVVFNRGGYRYHGRVEALAKGARDGGLKF